jgi:hypothetical protein
MIIITAAVTPPVGFLSPIISRTNSDQNMPINILMIPHESNCNDDDNDIDDDDDDDDESSGVIVPDKSFQVPWNALSSFW